MFRATPRAALCALCALCCLLAGPARGQEQLSVRPTLYFGGDDVDRGLYTTGLHVGLTGRSAEFWAGLSAEAELSVLLSHAFPGNGLALADNSSFLRLRWRPQPWRAGEGLQLTLLPLHSARLHLGYEFPVTSQVQVSAVGDTPGVDLRLVRAAWYVYVSAKSRVLLDDLEHEHYRRYTVFAGGGAELFSAVRLEAAAGYGDFGTNPSPSVLGAPVSTAALSARALYHLGPVIEPSLDYARFRNDPEVWERLLRADGYPGGFSTTVSGELLFLSQRGLADPATFGVSQRQSALAFQLEGRAKWNGLRASLRGLYRSVSFIQEGGPSTPPFVALASDARPEPEVGLSAAMDYHLARLHLTPGLGGGVLMPATLSTLSTLPPGTRPRTILVRDTNVLSILPEGTSRRLVVTAKATLRFDLDRFAAVGEVLDTYDPNRFSWTETFSSDGTGVIYDRSHSFGFNVFLQARF